MGKHRRISPGPSSASLPAAVSCRIRVTAKDAPPIDRPADPSPRAVKGAQAQVPSPAWSPGRRGQTPSAAAPIFSRPDVTSISRSGRSGQLSLSLLYIPDFHRGATRRLPGCCRVNGIGVARSAFGETLLTSRSVRTPLRNIAIAYDVSGDRGQELLELEQESQCFRGSRPKTWRDTALPAQLRAHPSCGPSRAPVRGIPRSRLAGRGVCSNVTTPSPVAFEEAPSRAPSRAGSSAERRGPDPGPRRSSILIFPRPLGASSHNNRGALVPSDSQEEITDVPSNT